MCGRISLSAADHRAAAILLSRAVPGFDSDSLAPWLARAGYAPHTNVGPGQPCWVVRGRNDRPILDVAHWGLHARDKPNKLIINARAETVEQRPLFRAAFARNRCLIPADGFFEWERRDGDRFPHWFHRPAREEARGALLLAAVLEPAHGPDAPAGFSIITVDAAGGVAKIHDRMPAIIERDEVRDWLFGDPHRSHALLRPRADLLDDLPVSREFNTVAYQGPLASA